jgi:EF-P beta-lysylation protein EpmB
MRVPQAFVDRMRHNDWDDPLLQQVLPTRLETNNTPGFATDPVGDQAAKVARGLLHKYQGRALLISTGACAVHCRYCFRQHFPYSSEHASGAFSQDAIDHIANTPSIEEVILSGGDPLMLATDRLRALTDQLATIGHIKRLRIHTRLPIVLPDRITPSLMEWLSKLPWPVVMVVHANHAQEFDRTVDEALARIATTGTTLFNQAVLLRGINDSIEALVDLMERSFAAGALPYYLHRLDRVDGAAHFDVSAADGLALMEALRCRLSGYLVPKFVEEVAGRPYKVPIL